MKIKNLGLGIFLSLSVLAASSASATVISANDIVTGAAGGLTFTANGGDLGLKTVAGVTGVGVTGGRTDGEIDLNQSIVASSATGFGLESTTLAFLFDGPEFNDVEEIAKITATFFGQTSPIVAILQNVYTSSTDLDMLLTIDGVQHNEFILGRSAATSNTAATVQLGSLFGSQLLSELRFEALLSTDCGAGQCTNQSDYSIAQITTVPEPGTLALLGLGLAGLGFVRRRKA